MDIRITTSDPNVINTKDIRAALERLHYFVSDITVVDREGRTKDEIALASLTPRESEVLWALMHGETVPTLSASWGTTRYTLRAQVRAILHKLEVNSQASAVAAAYRAGWRWEQADV